MNVSTSSFSGSCRRAQTTARQRANHRARSPAAACAARRPSAPPVCTHTRDAGRPFEGAVAQRRRRAPSRCTIWCIARRLEHRNAVPRVTIDRCPHSRPHAHSRTLTPLSRHAVAAAAARSGPRCAAPSAPSPARNALRRRVHRRRVSREVEAASSRRHAPRHRRCPSHRGCHPCPSPSP